MTDLHDADPQITTIADAVIRLKEIRESNKNLNEPDIEEKFARLSLAFKTDKFTLSKRLDLQQRQRDIAEKNIDCELKSLRESLNALNQLCTDSDMREVITKTQQHVDIVQQTTMRMSSRAETYGAIQQEQRMNAAFETMLSYVEHLKLLYDKEHMELEEYRRLLAEHNLLPNEKGSSDSTDDNKRILPPRSYSLSSSSKPEGRSRLLSAVCLLSPNTESSLHINGHNSPTDPSLSPKSRRASMPVGPLSSAVQTPPNFKLISSAEASLQLFDKSKSEKQETQRMREAANPLSSSMTDMSSTEAKSDEDKDCDICQGITSLPCLAGDCRAIDKDSRDLSRNSSFDDKLEPDSNFNPALPDLLQREMSSLSDCEEVVAANHCSSVSLLGVFRWTVDQGMWCFDGPSLLLRCRYVVSAVLATAAMLSLVLTFLPNIVEIVSTYL